LFNIPDKNDCILANNGNKLSISIIFIVKSYQGQYINFITNHENKKIDIDNNKFNKKSNFVYFLNLNKTSAFFSFKLKKGIIDVINATVNIVVFVTIFVAIL
jgi:hypothetical protein